MQPIAAQMPVHFANGALWEDFKGECKCCGNELPDDQVRGSVVAHSARMSVLEAVGVCHACRLLTRYLYRLHDNKTLSGMQDRTWRTWSANEQPFARRVFRALSRAFGKGSEAP